MTEAATINAQPAGPSRRADCHRADVTKPNEMVRQAAAAARTERASVAVLPLAQDCSQLHRYSGFAVADGVQGALGGLEAPVFLLRAEDGRPVRLLGDAVCRLMLLVLLLGLRQDRVCESRLDGVCNVGLRNTGWIEALSSTRRMADSHMTIVNTANPWSTSGSACAGSAHSHLRGTHRHHLRWA